MWWSERPDPSWPIPDGWYNPFVKFAAHYAHLNDAAIGIDRKSVWVTGWWWLPESYDPMADPKPSSNFLPNWQRALTHAAYGTAVAQASKSKEIYYGLQEKWAFDPHAHPFHEGSGRADQTSPVRAAQAWRDWMSVYHKDLVPLLKHGAVAFGPG